MSYPLSFVEPVRAVESKLGHAAKSHRLTGAVARYLFKLMAYKDEYEAARLHTDAAFTEKVRLPASRKRSAALAISRNAT